MERRSEIPLYRRIAEQLFADIHAGAFPVGSKLPGEHDLRARYDVSRHTVREALRLLEAQGVIDRHKGVGTVVTSTEPNAAYVQSIQSLEELLQYPQETQFRVESSTTVTADDELAERLGVDAGTRWKRFSGLRRLAASDLPLCWTDVYLPLEHAHVGALIGGDSRPVYRVIEEALGDVVQDVELVIGARVLPAPLAAALEVEPLSPAVTIVRRYHGRRSGLFEVSVSEHPAERFSYRAELTRGRLADGDA